MDQDFSPLDKEIQHIKDYLDIQRIRYGNHIDFALTFDEGLHDALVPSLLLQTFVENTIKHGFSFQDGISIELSLQKRMVEEKPYIEIGVKTAIILELLMRLNGLIFSIQMTLRLLLKITTRVAQEFMRSSPIKR